MEDSLKCLSEEFFYILSPSMGHLGGKKICLISQHTQPFPKINILKNNTIFNTCSMNTCLHKYETYRIEEPKQIPICLNRTFGGLLFYFNFENFILIPN